jgi:putative two-component system response regulator
MEILIVDDQEANQVLLQRLLATAGYTHTSLTSRPQDVFGACEEGRAQLVLLDLHMPGIDGVEVIRRLDTLGGASSRPPILVLTADARPDARRSALRAGANDFVAKPFDAAEVLLRVRNLLHARRLQLQLERNKRGLEDLVAARTAELEASRLEILDRLAVAAEYRDDETHEHARRIGRTAELLACELGLGERTRTDIRRAAPLHDIGKIGIPDSILLKPGKLTNAEFDEMKRHASIGADMLSGSRAPILNMAEQIARTHHERWDGSGYPAGLRGEAIPIVGRIVAVADVFDALTHRRPYKEAWEVDRALEEIRSNSGRQFDPRVVAAFDQLDHAALSDPVSHDDPLQERDRDEDAMTYLSPAAALNGRSARSYAPTTR